MSILLEQLASIGIDSVHCAGFRTCLVAIAQRIQTEPECSMLSLNDWLQWLDDEGYEREGFAAILQQICEHELGDQASTDLWSHGRAIAASADGISNLITHVHSVHPGLEQRMTELEALALEEESQIQHTAGGITKAGKIALYSAAGAVVVVGGIGIGVGVKKYLKRRAQLFEHQEAERFQKELNEKLDKLKADTVENVTREAILEKDSFSVGFNLSDLNDRGFKDCVHIMQTRLSKVHMAEPPTVLATELRTRLLKITHPGVYVHGFKKWAKESSKDVAENIFKPKDISMDLRHEFEGSKFAEDFLENYPTVKKTC